MKVGDQTEVRNGLLVEQEKLLKRLASWRAETTTYRWLNIILFMACKIIVPTGALIVAINMISLVLSKPLISDTGSAITFFSAICIAATVIFLLNQCVLSLDQV